MSGAHHTKEETMRTNDQGSAVRTLPSPWLVAAATALVALAAVLFLLNAPQTQAAGSAGTVVSTAKTHLGTILVDSRGRTLYLFGKDRNGRSACSGKCASFWPPRRGSDQTVEPASAQRTVNVPLIPACACPGTVQR